LGENVGFGEKKNCTIWKKKRWWWKNKFFVMKTCTWLFGWRFGGKVFELICILFWNPQTTQNTNQLISRDTCKDENKQFVACDGIKNWTQFFHFVFFFLSCVLFFFFHTKTSTKIHHFLK
jgi:hypothetical protein